MNAVGFLGRNTLRRFLCIFNILICNTYTMKGRARSCRPCIRAPRSVLRVRHPARQIEPRANSDTHATT